MQSARTVLLARLLLARLESAFIVMPGHKLLHTQVKDASLFDKYQCPHCKLLLKDAVQSACGHWLCDSCASELLEYR